MEDGRLDFIGEQLLNELLLCEKFVRRLFFDAGGAAERDDDPFRELTYDAGRVAVRTVLCNYIYDAYIRLVISEKKRYVERMENAGSLLFLWSVRRAAEMQPGLLRIGQDLATFSKLLNNLRRTSSLDILMTEALQFLDRAAAHAKQAAAVSEADGSTTSIARLTHMTARGEDSLVLLKTRYDPHFESKFFDHSSHYDEAFVPSHRFCNSQQSVLNMSRYVGYTMRENIRRLYKYVARHLGDQVCPCVVIFNFFIRDSYRMYYSKSLRQTSFVTVVRDAGRTVPLSYMIMTNLFPKVGSWFKSINNQLVKKTGKIHIQHLDSFVRMLTQLRYQENERTAISMDAAAESAAWTNASPTPVRRAGGDRSAPMEREAKLRKRKTITSSSPTSSASRVKRRAITTNDCDVSNNSGKSRCRKNQITNLSAKVTIAGENADQKRQNISGKDQASSTSSTPSLAGNAAATNGATLTRVSLSSLYRATDVTLFADMFSTRFRSCKHAHVVRTYEQLRANDESATLVRICLDCGNRL